jgi:hypothetical protein
VQDSDSPDFKGRIPAGVLDAAISSLSGFVIGFGAALLLNPEMLGVYAVFFSSYGLAMVLPSELALAPAEIASVRLPETERATILIPSLRVGVAIACAASLLTLLSIPFTAPIATRGQLEWLAIATATAAVFGPLEDHVRRVLHLSGRSWAAVAASSAMLISSILAIVLLSLVFQDRSGVPLTALAISNAASLITGLVLARPRRNPMASAIARPRALLSVGRWLVITGALPSGAEFVISGLVTTLAGAAYLGYAEAARVVAQPMFVLGVGLLRVLGPHSMKAGQDGLPEVGRRVRRTFLLLLLTGAVLYAGLAGWSWALNPFAHLLPKAYEIPGLVLIVVAANTIIGTGLSDRSELLGGRKERRVALTELGATGVALVVAASAGYTKAFARPLGRLLSGTFRASAFRRQVRHLYPSEAPEDHSP